ncbi:MAG: DNA alkylation repair protein [Lacipirellulaceae bacterium]
MAKKLKEWFDRDCAIRLGEAIQANFKKFDLESYAEEVDAGVGDLELKDRVLLMATGLHNRLPKDYERSARILLKSLGPPLQGETGMFTEGYWFMPVARLVEEFGRSHFDTSMSLCEEITRRHTSEYAVRPYLEDDTTRGLKFLRLWSRSPDAHVRRLASEGARPRLPWAKRLEVFIDDPEPAIKLVTPLRTDSSAYVRKSVANLLNDISKDHPDRIRELTQAWSREKNSHTDWIISHATRTLRKSKNNG